MSAARVPHLALVPEPPKPKRPRLAAPARRVSLCGSPFRPGEIPSPLALSLSEEHARAADEQASARGVPVELWLRIVLEGAVALERLTAYAPRERLELELSEQARQGEMLVPLESRLAAYARLLRSGETGSVTRTRGDQAELLVPAQVAASWLRESALSGETLGQWAARLLCRAPVNVLAWEAAAAEAGQGLREWAYACSLALIASASA